MSQPIRNAGSIDFGYSADRQSLSAFSPATTYSSPSPFLSSSTYSSASSPLISAPPSVGLYGQQSQQTSPSVYGGSYVSPTTLQGFDLYPSDNFGLVTPESCVFASPALPESNLNDLELAAYDDEEEAMYGVNEIAAKDLPIDMSQHKRARTVSEQDAGTRWIHLMSPGTDGSPLSTDSALATAIGDGGSSSSSSSSSKGKSKLRSASRTSKNANHKIDETTEERKTRNAHNIIEKQYRNRLNARFEGLLGVLPNSVRSSGTGNGDGEVRLTKGDVLDMSVTYIKDLENHHDELEKEREELNSSIDRLHAMLANEKRLNPDGFGGDGT
ncbi:hypothetical protein B0T16DRAFT_152434 [Cercophora newfieldiana]|uniref:BHLH domain-containing protein n=1 Tax=Cercophora newfieldiana TaxID=92897 RepID=A0AA40CR22_9PEZI|nr:hypothetical protein B0T16DRAFT_152434 [Cercophora newfieldiana]